MDTKKAALAGLGCLAVGFVLGYGSGRVSTGTPLSPMIGRGGYEDGYRAAMQKVADSGLLPPIPTESTSVTGKVLSVDSGSLRIEVDAASLDPLGMKSLPKERIVTVGAETKVTKVVEMTPEEYGSAQEAYQEAIAAYRPDAENPTPPPAPPSLFSETDIALGDIKAGDMLSVSAAKDILAAATIDAVTVTVLLPTVAPSAATSPAPDLPPPTEDPERPAAAPAETREEAPRI